MEKNTYFYINRIIFLVVGLLLCPAILLSSYQGSVLFAAPPAGLIAEAGTDTVICSNSYFLKGNPLIPGESGLWTVDNPSATIVNESSPNSEVRNLEEGITYTFTWTIDDGAGNSNSDDVKITYQTTSLANAGDNQCIVLPFGESSKDLFLLGNPPNANETVSWSVISSPNLTNALINTPNTYSTSVSGATQGTHIFQYEIENSLSGCKTNDEATIIVLNEAVAGSDICLPLSGTDTTINLSGTIPGIGESILWSVETANSSASVGFPNQSNSSLSSLKRGTHLIKLKVTNSGCIDSTEKRISVLTKNKNSSDSCILSDTYNLSGTTLSPIETGTWNFSSGKPYIIDLPSNSSASVSLLEIGLNKLWWNISDSAGYCVTSDTIKITTLSNPDAGPNQCVPTPPNATQETIQLEGSGYNAAEESVSWRSVSGNFLIGNSQTAFVQLPVGKHIITYSIKNEVSGCIRSDTVLITIISRSIAGTNQCYTLPVSSIVLNANNADADAGETGTWLSPTGLSFDLSNPLAVINNPPAGVHKLTWTIDNEGCRDSSYVTFSIIDAPEAGTDQCIPFVTGGAQVTLSAEAINENYSNGFWTIASNAPSQAAVFTPNDSNITTASNLQVGVNKFFWNISDTASSTVCSAIDSVEVTVITAPNAGPDQCHVLSAISKTINFSGNANDAIKERGFWTSKEGISITNSDKANASASLPTGKFTFYWNIENIRSGCVISDSITITLVSKAIAGSDQCINNTETEVFFNAAPLKTNIGEVGEWTQLNSPGNVVFDDPTSPVSEIFNLTVGIHSFQWKVENSGCSDSATVQISVVSNATVSENLCIPFTTEANTNTILKANPIQENSETGYWSISQNSPSALTAIISSPSSDSTLVNGLKRGVNYFIWKIEDTSGVVGGCYSVDTLTVTVNTQPDAGSDQCLPVKRGQEPLTVNLSGNTPYSGETGFWTTHSAAIISDATTRNTTTSLNQGRFDFFWNIQNEITGCKFQEKITVRVITKSVAGNSRCVTTDLANAFLNADPYISTSGETGTWSSVNNPSYLIIDSKNDPKTKVSGFRVGVHRLKWTISNDNCIDESFINISIVSKPNPGPKQCLISTGELTETTLAANSINFAENATWIPSTNSLSKVIINQPSNPNSALKLRHGTSILYWNIRDTAATHICNVRDSITLSVINDPDAGSDLCEIIPLDQLSKAISIEGLTLDPTENATWTTTSPGLNLSGSNTIKVRIDSIPSGKHLFTFKIESKENPQCFKIDTVFARVISSSYAGPNQCLTAPTGTSVANTSLSADSAKVSKSETGAWISPEYLNFDRNSNKPVLLNIPFGVHEMKWVISNETCKDTSSVLVSVQTKAEAGISESVCGTITTINANQFHTGTEIGIWSKKDLSSPVIITNKDNPSTSVENLTPYTNHFIWTISDNLCANSDTVIIINNQPTEINILTQDQHTCFTTNPIKGNDPRIEIPTSKSLWKIISQPNNNTTVISDPNADSTSAKSMNVAGIYKFAYLIFNSVCDTISDTLEYERDATLLNVASARKQVCITDTVRLTAQAPPADGTGIWELIGGSAVFDDPTDPNTFITEVGIGNNVLYWKLQRGVCENIANVDITGFDVPSEAVLTSSDTHLCETDSFLLEAEKPVVGIGEWTIVSGSGEIVEPNSNSTIVRNIGFGTNEFKWTVKNGPCDSSQATITVERFQQAGSASAGTDIYFCGNSLTLNALPVTVGTGLWEVISGTANIITPTLHNSAVQDIHYGINKLTWKIQNGICSSTDTLLIVAGEPVDKAVAGSDTALCETDNMILEANNPNIGTGRWYSISSVHIQDSLNHKTSVGPLPTGKSKFVWVIKKEFCESRDTIEVIRDIKPEKASAGIDIEVYSSEITLDGLEVKTGKTTWHSSTDVNISDINDPKTSVSNIPFGKTYLVLTVSNGVCPANMDSVLIERREFDLPNAFSPNGDDKNNVFEIRGIQQYAPAEFTVLNRWGQKVFYSSDYQNTWDGKNSKGEALVDDTYYYILKLNTGKTFQGYIVMKR